MVWSLKKKSIQNDTTFVSSRRFILDEFVKVAYSSRDNTISIINEFGKGTSCAKIDSDSAFRLIPIHPVGHEVFGIF